MIKLRISGEEQVFEELTNVDESMSEQEVVVESWDDFDEMCNFASTYLGEMGSYDYPDVTVADEEAFDKFHWECIDRGRYDDGDYL